MTYRILIEKIETEPFDKQEWQKVADTGNSRDGGPVYGYTACPTVREVTTKLLEQTLERLDLQAIILAANGIVLPHIGGERE